MNPINEGNMKIIIIILALLISWSATAAPNITNEIAICSLQLKTLNQKMAGANAAVNMMSRNYTAALNRDQLDYAAVRYRALRIHQMDDYTRALQKQIDAVQARKEMLEAALKQTAQQ